jgi:hypothetical protein
MKNYKMVARKDLETGETGLMFSDCPIINYPMVANEGLLVAHDLLEHVNGLDKIGSIDDELEALGGVWFVRGNYGVLRRNSQSYISPDQSLASDVLNMARIYNNGVEFKTDVPTIYQDSYMYNIAVEICELARNDIPGEIEEDELDQGRIDFYLKSAVAYIVNGYEKASAKFEQFEVNQLFWNIAETIDNFLKHEELMEGQEFILIVDYEDLTATFEEDIEEDAHTISIEFDGSHYGFTVYDNDTYEVDQWLINNGLEYVNSDTQCALSEIEDLLEDGGSIVLPVDETRDLTIFVAVEG